VGELVTVLFTDIEGSTRLARQLGPGDWGNALAAHHRLVGEAVARHGGRVVQTEGDAFLTFFQSATAGGDGGARREAAPGGI
jgi:adenylate cyclase